jgi:hypothetical protein
MANRDRRNEAFRAGFENPLMGDIGPLQRLYGTVSAIGEELGGGDMGTPFGQRFAERQKATKADIKRLQELRARHPEEFGRGMMHAQEQMDPYMLGLGTGAVGGMRPMGSTRFTPAPGEAPIRALEGPGGMQALPAPAPRMMAAPQGMAEAAPAAPYYRNVPPEMGTSMRPMTPFQQNQVGLSTGRFGMQGYAPEMAVTDFETYAPGGMGRTTSGPTPINKFDQNMMDAYRRGRMGTGASRGMYGEYTPEEMGSAITPYRQGGLVYEPVGQQGAAPRQIGGPQGAPRLGYERGPIEGQWSEVYGLQGPQGRPGYGGGMDFGVTREGMAMSPTGMRFDPRLAAAAIGGTTGYMAGRGGEPRAELPVMDVYARRGPHAYGPEMPRNYGPEMSLMTLPNNPMQGPVGGATLRSENMPMSPAEGRTAKGKGGKKEEKAAPQQQPAFEGNLNYYVTQALDRLFGQGEAERGRQYQEYYATNPWPY